MNKIDIIKASIGILLILSFVFGIFYIINLGVQSEIESNYNYSNRLIGGIPWAINPANPAVRIVHRD